MSGKRCSYCNHLWRFHSKAPVHSKAVNVMSCSKCVMREDKGEGFLPKGAVLNSHPWHTLLALMPNCRCYRKHRKGVCAAVIFHGPGHQSHTHCFVKGRHSVHRAALGGQEASWARKGKTFTSYFDEPPVYEGERES